jgi:multidrug efflux pump subunit AcrA (membrane-fusion protein)
MAEHSLRKRVVGVGVVTALLAAGGAAAWASSGGGGLGYRTAVVTTGDVQQLLTGTGTIALGRSTPVGFTSSGTVASVPVAQGQQVKAGQVLATLSTGPLDLAVLRAEATLAKARAALESDQTPSSTGQTNQARVPAAPVRSSAPPAPAPAAPAPAALGPAARSRAEQTLQRAAAALRTAMSICSTASGHAPSRTPPAPTPPAPTSTAPTTPAPSSTPTGTPAPSSTPTGTPAPSSTPTGTPAPSSTPTGTPAPSSTPTGSAAPSSTPTGSAAPSSTPTASGSTSRTGVVRMEPASLTGAGRPPAPALGCTAALSAALNAQQQVQRTQQQLQQALAGPTRTGDSAPRAQKAPNAPPAAATAGVRSSAEAGTASGAAASSSGLQGAGGRQLGSDSLTLVSRTTVDAAAVEAGQVALLSAQADRRGATLLSPLTGTVAVQPYTAGAAESAKDRLTVTAPGAAQIVVDVPLSSIASLRTGLHAVVQPDGGTTPATGTVNAIGLLPSSAPGTSPTTYPLTVLVPTPSGSFFDGGRASVSIVEKVARDVVTVPNSALIGGTVRVMQGSSVVPSRVQTGAVGALTTEVTSGVSPGQQVVLADLSQPLPASSTTITRRLTGGGGGGRGGGAGGLGGGRPPGKARPGAG